MNNTATKKSGNLVSTAFNKLFSRLTQSAEVYPIKYYMRKKRGRREGYIYSMK